jgi:hypothetical protein
MSTDLNHFVHYHLVYFVTLHIVRMYAFRDFTIQYRHHSLVILLPLYMNFPAC